MEINIEKNKIETIRLWNSVEREGIDRLIDYLLNSDYFVTAGSAYRHLAVVGGLAQHSLNVYDAMDMDDYLDTKIIVSLGHDLCKIGKYKKGGKACSDAQYKYYKSLSYKCSITKRNLLDSNNLLDDYRPSTTYAGLLIDWLNGNSKDFPVEPVEFTFADDPFPFGHGEKSAYIISKFIKLTDEEALAIRWHMGAWDLAKDSRDATECYNAAVNLYPLVTKLQIADMVATKIIEREEPANED